MDFHGLKKIGFPVLTTGCVLSGVSCIDQTPRDLANMNIILFMVDDMGLNDTQVPFLDGGSTLNQYYYTPNMVRLAEKGVRFTSAYACPVSSPTRVSLMTGSNAARHRVTNWTLDMNVNTDSFGGNNALTSQNWNYNGISPDLGSDATQDNIYESTCFPEVLRQNGYRTIHLGKAHWGPSEHWRQNR
ncbi:MAG: sulfatase-like hydrolase/transferase [Spirochaetia bacterium]|nr:sulfatase-like hydrolase/transferase [Spirochaetia bacterium]